MKTLLMMRHAKSSWKHADLSDYERPLKKRGKHDAPKMGALLRRQNLTPQLIISSSAKRARQTAELVAEGCSYEKKVRLTRDFYAAGPEAYIEALQQLDESYASVMVIGHNPGMEMLLEALTDAFESFPTAALAHVRLPIANWQDITEDTEGKLIDLWVPRQVL